MFIITIGMVNLADLYLSSSDDTERFPRLPVAGGTLAASREVYSSGSWSEPSDSKPSLLA